MHYAVDASFSKVIDLFLYLHFSLLYEHGSRNSSCPTHDCLKLSCVGSINCSLFFIHFFFYHIILSIKKLPFYYRWVIWISYIYWWNNKYSPARGCPERLPCAGQEEFLLPWAPGISPALGTRKLFFVLY